MEAALPEFVTPAQQGHLVPPGKHLNGLSLAETSLAESSSASHSVREKESGVLQANTTLLRPSASPSPYHSSRIKSLKESIRAVGGTAPDFHIKASKVTWTEGTLRDESDDHELAREKNMKAFRELERHKMFKSYTLEINENDPVGEGGEAEIYSADGTLWEREMVPYCRYCCEFPGSYCKWCLGSSAFSYPPKMPKLKVVERKQLVLKVYKEGFVLSDLLKEWSPRWTAEAPLGRSNESRGAGNLCWAVGAHLFDYGKFRGRFALLLPRYECDLRRLIDRKKLTSQVDGPPFERDHALFIVHELAKGMAGLHELGLLHRDLKAANILCNCKDGLVDEMSVADFESSYSVIGTKFWRAPEILKALKNRVWSPHPVTEASDVYSFAMTCYEVVTGLVPLEGVPQNQYDGPIAGDRPKLPDDFCPELNILIRTCWQDDPSQRPSFPEIVSLVDNIRLRLSR